jgi:uncharacterized membrane protein
MPAWALTLAYTLHMAATVSWVGGLLFQAAILMPAIQRSLDPAAAARLLETLRRRFDPLAWLSLAVLVATGLTQMGANPNYEGFLAFGNRWAAAILAKHAVIAGMVGLAAYQTWFLYPRLTRLTLVRGGAPEAAAAASRQQASLGRLNLIFSAAVLALTAIARTA